MSLLRFWIVQVYVCIRNKHTITMVTTPCIPLHIAIIFNVSLDCSNATCCLIIHRAMTKDQPPQLVESTMHSQKKHLDAVLIKLLTLPCALLLSFPTLVLYFPVVHSPQCFNWYLATKAVENSNL